MEKYIHDYLMSLELDLRQTGVALIHEMLNAHIAKYPFSSANVILNKPLSLSPEALFQRVIANREGGYCFEHNKIIYLALAALGFNVRPLIGRVMLNGDASNGRSHRLTLVSINEQDYVVDAGFGVLNPRCIFPLQAGHFNSTYASYQMHVSDAGFRITQDRPQGELTLYRFDLAEMTEFDCEIGHHFSSTHPNAAFVNNLVVSRIEAAERFLVRNLTFTHYNDENGTEQQQLITSPMALQSVLNTKLQLPITELEACVLFQHQRKFVEAA